MNFDELLPLSTMVDTPSAPSGYPSHLRTAFIRSTMGGMRELRDAAVRDGHEVTEVLLHRRDGWVFWHRKATGWIIDGTNWQSSREDETTLKVDNKTNVEQEVFDLIVGDASDIGTMAGLRARTQACEDLLHEITDPMDLEDGESIVYFLDPDEHFSVRYQVHSDDNGYSYDTHQYRIGLLIERNEADYWDGNGSLKQ